MLIRFEAANHRSIKEPVELSMVAIDRDRREATPHEPLGESLLPVAAIYGPNASGKSNVLGAFQWLREAARLSLKAWDTGIPVDPFASVHTLREPSRFVAEFALNGVRFEYVLELSAEEVSYEALFHYPLKKRKKIFERDGLEISFQAGLGELSGTRKLLTPRTLALTVAHRFREPLVSGLFALIANTQVLGSPSGRRSLGEARSSTQRLFEDEYGYRQPTLFADSDEEWPALYRRERALEMLKFADLGIEDVIVERRADSDALAVRRSEVEIVHSLGKERAQFGLSEESHGTQTWFKLIGPSLQALSRGSLLLFDELDASLHPTLSAELIRIFRDPVTNPRRAQLIFTSHDTNLLNHLNRDEVWFTTKNQDGSTHLGALAEFAGERVRTSQNLESGYLHGKFGALPDLDRRSLLRALGLVG